MIFSFFVNLYLTKKHKLQLFFPLKMHYHLNQKTIAINIEGESSFGSDNILSQQDDNLIENTDWKDRGYTIIPFFDPATLATLKKGLADYFIYAMRQAGFDVPDDFDITKYHRLPGLTQEKHLEVISTTKLIEYPNFPIDPALVVELISDLVKVPLTLKNPQTGEEIYHLRIVRPNSSDFNPIHRDGWMDELKHSLNLYAGIAGSTELSSLCVVPGSHLWPESRVEKTINGAIMNGAQYNVPALIQAKEELNLIRPNPGENEVMVFTPYLIHGGAANLNADETRVSLELRLWRK